MDTMIANITAAVEQWVSHVGGAALDSPLLGPVTKDIIENSPLWDRRFWNLQVSDASEKTIQLRALATSADSSKSWDVRCEIRENFVSFIQQHHPAGLPRLRADVLTHAPVAD